MAWLVVPLLVLLVIDAWMTHQRARVATDTAFDRTLLASVKAISGGVRMADGQVQVDIPYMSLDMFETETSGPVFYRVSLANGTALTGYEDLPLPSRRPPFYRPVYYNTQYKGHPLRVAAIMHPVYDLSSNESRVVWVAVGETTQSREEIARRILVGSLLQEGFLAALALTAVWGSVTFAIRPLSRLSALVRQRDAEDLRAIDEEHSPREIRVLVNALNQYTERMQQMLIARRRFFSDAAHQLKTPLAVLQAQSELLLRDAKDTTHFASVEQIHSTTRQAAAGVAKLLSLSRLEPDSGDVFSLVSVDLIATARTVAREWVPVADNKGIDLGFEGEGKLLLPGQPDLLAELIGNLVDNAIKYCASGCTITVRVQEGSDEAVLQVIDDGPGIPATEREKVFKRFYRSSGNSELGTGLGLSIVREISRVHHGAVVLTDSANGGLTVSVTLPKAVGVAGDSL